MRPNKVGWFIVAFFLIGGAFFYLTIPGIWIGQIWMATALFLAALYLFMNWRADRKDELRASGIPATGTILEMTQTGVYINNMPQVRLRLRIESQELQPYEITKTVTVPHIALGALSTGRPLQVYVDRKDQDEIAIDFFGGAAPGAGNSAVFTVSPQGSQPISVTDAGVQQDLLKALRDHGINPADGSAIDLRRMPEARAAVLEALNRHGIDAAHATAAADPTTPIEDSGDPMDRITKLQGLRDANLITEDEFDQHRKRILEDI